MTSVQPGEDLSSPPPAYAQAYPQLPRVHTIQVQLYCTCRLIASKLREYITPNDWNYMIITSAKLDFFRVKLNPRQDKLPSWRLTCQYRCSHRSWRFSLLPPFWWSVRARHCWVTRTAHSFRKLDNARTAIIRWPPRRVRLCTIFLYVVSFPK